MRESGSARVLAIVSALVLVAACADQPTAPTQQFEKFGGQTANITIALLGSVTPLAATVPAGGTQPFTALNTLGKPMVTPLTWSVSGGGGTIAATVATGTGLFTAGPAAGTFTISVFSANGSVTVTATVTVTVAAGCKSDDDKKVGDKSDGDKKVGEKKDGDKSDGDKKVGEKKDGDKSDGDKKNCDEDKDHKDKEHRDKDKDGDKGGHGG